MEQANETGNGLISVIVPVYNVTAWLRECVESIRAQTHRQLEIILVDDGSTDDSGELCDAFAVMDNRIRVLHRPNGGVGNARNAGLDAATGSYIAWVDADDVIEPDMLECLYAAGTDVAACAYSTFGSINEVRHCEPSGKYEQPRILEVLSRADGGTLLWNKLTRATMWEGLRFPPCPVLDDEVVCFNLLVRAKSLTIMDRPLYHYRIHPGSVMHSIRPEDVIIALEVACVQYTAIKTCEPDLSIYLLVSVYNIMRRCMRTTAGKRGTFKSLRQKIAPAAMLVAERRVELRRCLRTGLPGLMEIEALASGSFWACRFSRLCQRLYDWKRSCNRSKK